VYPAVADVVDVAPGLYRYVPDRHSLEAMTRGDVRSDLTGAVLGQEPVATAPVSLVITAAISIAARRYGSRATRYAHLEAGHVAQNIALEAVALGLGVVPIGAFDDGQVSGVVGSERTETALYVLPSGWPAASP
jgi:SagB-type dehydrogenase family enzyme